jgi:hypothetical protein
MLFVILKRFHRKDAKAQRLISMVWVTFFYSAEFLITERLLRAKSPRKDVMHADSYIRKN